MSCGGEEKGFNFGQVECYLPVGYPKRVFELEHKRDYLLWK